jgi:hypothetical protein
MVGYTFAIFSSVVSSTLLMTNSTFTKVDGEWVLKTILHFYPTFPFNRIVYLLVDGCSFDKCYSRMDFVTDEMWKCTYAVYFDAVLYLIIAMYLEEVVPQTFGVPRHPLFFMEGLIKAISPKMHK